MRVVLDTNVIISALNFPGNERLVLELALRGRFELYLSRFILEEAAGALVRKFGWDEERAAQAVLVIENAAIIIDPPRLPEVVEGCHADNRVLECAATIDQSAGLENRALSLGRDFIHEIVLEAP